ncbi:molybdenum cofactor guanylyltransferase [Novosphingobium kunmingense]|uniref:Molybdenum cofactor guanylyltransferase n=1 Tax=Novosphingobium kunmingense TaxID=1211806 RepID=A0A2N0H736_9SPHN|nr:molybdenum cofactor guanylyltransferase [Novosphingobium kunmingense]PKB14748.1 molybdenum cofactor guanylyltransferase [Novosphingobium kunmingense]
MRLLGAVLAGGLSSRFGSDKALAALDGQTLLDRAVERLAVWCDSVVVVGREAASVPTLPDWPRPGMGPLGGIAAALRHASDHGFAEVLTIGVDSPGLPDDLPERLAPAPAYVADQPVIALWPVNAAEAVTAILEGDGRHSMIALAERVGARAVRLPGGTANINTPGDLARIAPRG